MRDQVQDAELQPQQTSHLHLPARATCSTRFSLKAAKLPGRREPAVLTRTWLGGTSTSSLEGTPLGLATTDRTTMKFLLLLLTLLLAL